MDETAAARSLWTWAAGGVGLMLFEMFSEVSRGCGGRIQLTWPKIEVYIEVGTSLTESAKE